MDRRAFLTALAAVTGATAFPWLPAHEQPLGSIDRATYVWWQSRDPIYYQGYEIVWDHEREMHSKMQALFDQCVSRTPDPGLVWVDGEIKSVRPNKINPMACVPRPGESYKNLRCMSS